MDEYFAHQMKRWSIRWTPMILCAFGLSVGVCIGSFWQSRKVDRMQTAIEQLKSNSTLQTEAIEEHGKVLYQHNHTLKVYGEIVDRLVK